MYWVDLDPARGSEQAGHRPAVVVSPSARNKGLRTVVIAACTTKFDGKPHLGNVRDGKSLIAYLIPKGYPTDEDCAVLCHQILTVDLSRLEGYMGRLTDHQVREVDRRMAQLLGVIPSLNGKQPLR